MPAGASGTLPEQELRIATTMVGGVSLAVWMGGLAYELQRLVRGEDSTYTELCRLLNISRVSVDVLAGTSAGGINAAALALALSTGGSVGRLRDLWLDLGALDRLIRSPYDKQPPSLMYGDGVLLRGLREGLENVRGPGDQDGGECTLLLTTSLLTGVVGQVTDDYGTRIGDVDHHGLLTFRQDALRDKDCAGKLALAARSSASFPFAFEPSRLPAGETGDATHPDMAAHLNVTGSRWAVDGGLLANRPVGPALAEIFRRPASQDVRRVLVYVTPTTDVTGDLAGAGDPAEPPALGRVLERTLGAATAQSISADLAAWRRHNEQVDRVRTTRDYLVRRFAEADRYGVSDILDTSTLDCYVRTRAAREAREIAAEVARQHPTEQPAGPEGDQDWLRVAQARRLERLRGAPVPLEETLPRLGQELFGRAAALLLDLISGAYDTLTDRRAQVPGSHPKSPAPGLNGVKERLAALRTDVGVPGTAEDLRGVVAAVRGTGVTAPALVSTVADQWPDTGEVRWDHWAELGRLALEVARILDRRYPPDAESNTAAVRLAHFLRRTDTTRLSTATECAQRLGALAIVEQVLLGDDVSGAQRVDFVQFSADTRTALLRQGDEYPMSSATDKLTALQLHHFGGFYKQSWRANDWMWGRIDGAGWLVQCLLDPVRLETLRDIVGPERFREEFVAALKPLWRKPDELDRCTPAETGQLRDQLTAELAFLGLDADLEPVAAPDADRPISMPVTAMVLARTRQAEIAAEELPVVTLASRYDADDRPGIEKALAGDLPRVDVGAAQAQFQACRVSAEKLAGEQGTARLTRTLVALGAATVNAGTVAFRLPGGWPQTVAGMLRTVARSTARVSQGASRLGTAGSLVAGVLALLAGLVIGNNGGAVLQWVGLPVLAGAAVYLATALLTTGHKVRWLFTALGALVVAALLLAAFLPPLARPFFGWLGDVVAGWRRGEGAVWWLAVSGLLILPAVVMPVSGAWRRLRHRRGA